jgi:hypothetical protein
MSVLLQIARMHARTHAGLVPVISFTHFMVSLHLEKVCEIAIMAIMEPVSCPRA